MKNLKCGAVAKFSVFKTEDVEKYLSKEQIAMLEEIDFTISKGRAEDGKSIGNEYVIINTDETYALEVIDIMKRNGHWG